MFRTLFLGFCFSIAALCGPETDAHLERAALHEAQGQIGQASAEFQSAVASAASGSDPVELVRALDLACAHYQDTGQTAQSEPCLRRLLVLSRNLLGAQDISLNRIFNRLACVYIELRQPARAERLQLPQWLARLSMEAPLSTDRIDLLGTLAALALIRGKPSESIALNREAWTLIERRKEIQTPSAMTALNNLAIAYREAKQYGDSEAALLRALSIGAQGGFEDGLAMAYTHSNLAYLYQALRRYAAAEQQIAAALVIVQRRCGADSPRTAALLSTHATVLRKLGRKEEARAAETRARSAFTFTGHSVDVADLARGH